MPSGAYQKFLHNAVDVNRLIDSHGELSSGHSGKKALGHITRSGVIMLCAAWEVYVEDLLIESVKYISMHKESPLELPKPVQKHLAKRIKENKNELKLLELGGAGWREIYVTYCQNETRSINTPKTTILEAIYEKFIGIENLSSLWNVGGGYITDFVSTRGDIAHKGRSAPYVNLWELIEYNDCIHLTAKEMDNQVCMYVFDLVTATVQPWRKIQ